MPRELPIDRALLNTLLRHIARGQSGAEITLSFSVKDNDTLRQRVLASAVQTAKTEDTVTLVYEVTG